MNVGCDTVEGKFSPLNAYSNVYNFCHWCLELICYLNLGDWDFKLFTRIKISEKYFAKKTKK